MREAGSVTDPPADPGGWFVGRHAAITTQHQKERQFAGPLGRLGMALHLARFDTDTLGTFTGTLPRTDTPLATARTKARLAVELTGFPVGLGSEGSYGPHPALPFITAGVEIVVYADSERNLEVVEHLITTETNHDAITIRHAGEATAFLYRVGFPDHAVVVGEPAGGPVATAVTDPDRLVAAIDDCLARCGEAQLSADLRAHLNPTRQRALSQLAEQLVCRLASRCPSCLAPGWGVTEREPGRPCGLCGTPTDLVAVDVWTCAAAECGHRFRSERDEWADPANCPWCNP